jgi:hypothetical protein
VFFINLCNLIYRCGCRSLWSGAAEACNIHVAGVKHCPFCSYGAIGYGSVLALVLIPQLMVSWWPAHWDWRTRLMSAVLVFPVMMAVAALVLGLASGYWR